MKVVILAGGFGTRISEETETKPKPMVGIDEQPILWHIMKIYSHFGFNDFVICLGYKGYVIKEYFINYHLHRSDVTIDMKTEEVNINKSETEPWRVTLVDTGLETLTGGRIKRIQKYINGETFMFTYGDGVGNININELIQFHKSHGKCATITSVQPLGRFGALVLDDKCNVSEFEEKPKGDGDWINGGFCVMDPKVFDYIPDDSTSLEDDVFGNLAQSGQLAAYKHYGFWQPMDTLRDKLLLERLWKTGKAPWKLWND